MNQQSILAVAKPNWFMGCISKNLPSRTKDLITPLYSALLKPCLECCISFGPSSSRDTGRLERVQKGASMMIRGLKNLTQEKKFCFILPE